MIFTAPKLLRLIRQSRLDPHGLRVRRALALRRFVDETLIHSPFHLQRLRAAGIDPRELTEPERLACLPVMEREDVRSQAESIVNTRVRPGRRFELRTSGSCGVPLKYWITQEERTARQALHQRACWLAGRRLFEREAVIGSKPPATPPRPWDRGIYLSALTDPSELSDRLRTFAPSHLIAFPSTLMRLGEHPGFRPKLITTGSEVLEPEVRRAIETRFGAPVRDIYGSIETGLLAFQCMAGQGYHLNEDEVIFEMLPSTDGLMELLVTPLHGRAMPLVRYRLGDLIRPLGTSCPCGSTLTLIASVEGRRDDWLVRPDGSQVPPAAIRALFRRGERLFRYRVTQDNGGEVLLELAPDATARPDGARLGSELESIVGRRVRTEFVPCIAPDPSGKLTAIRRLEGARLDPIDRRN